jgi:cell division septal protein FtsQ
MKRLRKHHLIKRKKSILKNRFFWIGILILVILVEAFYLICFPPVFQVEKIEISETQKTDIKELIKMVQNQIKRKIFSFPTKSIFLVNLSEIAKEAQENFPQIAKISLTKRLPDILIIQIEEREPIAIFLQDEECFFVDREGIIFERVFVLGDERLNIKKPTIDEVTLGDEVFSEEGASQILFIEKKLKKELNINPQELLIVSEERWNIKTSEGWEIYLNPQGDLEWQLTKLRLDLEEEIPPERRKDLEYIELRFGNFAPYKYSDSPQVTP